jgi:hypothetical protein
LAKANIWQKPIFGKTRSLAKANIWKKANIFKTQSILAILATMAMTMTMLEQKF